MTCDLYRDLRGKWESLVSGEGHHTECDPFDTEDPAVVAYWEMIEHRMFCEACREFPMLGIRHQGD